MKDGYKISKDVFSRVNLLLNNVEIAKGVDNAIRFAQMCQLLQQVEEFTDIVIEEKEE